MKDLHEIQRKKWEEREKKQEEIRKETKRWREIADGEKARARTFLARAEEPWPEVQVRRWEENPKKVKREEDEFDRCRWGGRTYTKTWKNVVREQEEFLRTKGIKVDYNYRDPDDCICRDSDDSDEEGAFPCLPMPSDEKGDNPRRLVRFEGRNPTKMKGREEEEGNTEKEKEKEKGKATRSLITEVIAWNIAHEEDSEDSDEIVNISTEEDSSDETDKKKKPTNGNLQTANCFSRWEQDRKEWGPHIKALEEAIQRENMLNEA